VGQIPRWLYWATLFAMACTVFSQVLTGFDRPLHVVTASLAAGLAVASVVGLVLRHRRGKADRT
jgi:ABC-type dipeptide/oligopeptide/nickel transport system permease subunit